MVQRNNLGSVHSMSYFKNWLKLIILLIFAAVLIVHANITSLKTISGINDWIDAASVITIIGVIIGVFFYLSTIKWNFYQYLADLYYVILQKSFENPNYCNPEMTKDYEKEWPHNPEKHEYEIFARTCWAYLEDIYATSLKSKWLLANEDIINIYAPTFERIKTIHGAWLKNNKSIFPMKGFLEFIDSNKWRDYIDPSKAKLLRWNYASYDYDEKILNPLQVKKNNPLVKYIKEINGKELIVADVGCGPGSLISNYLESDDRFSKIYGIDYSDSMIKIAKEKCENFQKVEFLKMDVKDLAPLRKKLNLNKLDIIFSINSIFAEDPNEIDMMLCQIALTLKSGGKLIAVLPSFDTVEYLRDLELEKFKNERTEYSEICFENSILTKKINYYLEGFYELCKLLYYILKFHRRMDYGAWKLISLNMKEFGALFDTWKLFYHDRKMNNRKKLYADDGVNIQRFFHDNDIKPLFEKFGLNIIECKKLKYPWDLAEKFGYGYFPEEKKIWDRFIVAEKS